MNTKFYHFRQNNSGGSFRQNEKVNVHVIIEACSAEHANARAEHEFGIYFHGVSDGMDCDCCGDRWYHATEHDGANAPHIYGGEIPDGANDVVIHKLP